MATPSQKNQDTFHGSTLFVSNLPYSATSTDLKTLFSDIAPVRSAFVVLEHGTGVSKGVGYVSFAITEDAKAAFDRVSADGMTLDGRSLRVEWAANRPGRAERDNKVSDSKSPKRETTARPKSHVPTSSRDPLAIRTAVISGLPSVDSKGLWKKFRKYEGAIELQWPVKRDNGLEDASTAHVVFSSPSTAQAAVNKLHAHVFKGALLSVTLKKRLDDSAKQLRVSTPAPSRASRLIVRNLPFDITEQDLRAIFLPHGSIYSVDIPQVNKNDDVKAESSKSAAPQRGKGFAFVWMWNRKEAETAMNACNGTQLHAGLASDLIKQKQKKKKALRQEKKQAEASKGLVDSGRIIAVDWALSKSKWEEEKKHLDRDTSSGFQSEQEGDDDLEGSQAVADEQGEPDSDDGEGSGDEATVGDDSDHRETTRPTLPPPEAGTTLFIRNIPFLATEDELRALFRNFGPLRYARMTMDAATGRSRGTGFVCFWNLTDADKVVEQSDIIRTELAGATEAPVPKKNPFAMASILTPDPSAPSAQSLVLHGRTLDVVRAVTREEAGKLKEENEKAREKADKRNTYLLREGVILPNTAAAESLSATEVQKRADSHNARRALLASNPSLYVSKTRLSIRHIPTFVTERMLKRLATHAMQTFDDEVAAGSRTGLTEEELARDEPVSGADESRHKGGPTPRVRQAKIIRQADRVDPLTGKGRSKGYGFLELREHADALRVLRWTNNNPDVPSLLVEWWPAELEVEKKGADPSRAKRIAEAENQGATTKHPKGTLIVEFSIENVQVVQRRTARQHQNVDNAGEKRKLSPSENKDSSPAKKRRTAPEGSSGKAEPDLQSRPNIKQGRKREKGRKGKPT
ncbi:hypothetical protein EDB92DRAFT_1933612 [Lactarius akahatsu]|uniref:RRM domain-containing protein n=1 Tax=Lactarius akahatsu TaxID=416441 RepID=A0AAD4LMW9_9AGAM|nr:hypothetical protein EDB92DRAFT_1933612 [Lactarius akahatsu]